MEIEEPGPQPGTSHPGEPNLWPSSRRKLLWSRAEFQLSQPVPSMRPTEVKPRPVEAATTAILFPQLTCVGSELFWQILSPRVCCDIAGLRCSWSQNSPPSVRLTKLLNGQSQEQGRAGSGARLCSHHLGPPKALVFCFRYIFKRFISLDWKGRYMKGRREKGLASAGSFPKWPHWPELVSLNPGAKRFFQVSHLSPSFLCFPK